MKEKRTPVLTQQLFFLKSLSIFLAMGKDVWRGFLPKPTGILMKGKISRLNILQKSKTIFGQISYLRKYYFWANNIFEQMIFLNKWYCWAKNVSGQEIFLSKNFSGQIIFPGKQYFRANNNSGQIIFLGK